MRPPRDRGHAPQPVNNHGFGAPIAGGLIDRFGPRRVAIAGRALIAGGLLPMLWMREEWQLFPGVPAAEHGAFKRSVGTA